MDLTVIACPVCGAIDGTCFLLPLTKPPAGEIAPTEPEPAQIAAPGQVAGYVSGPPDWASGAAIMESDLPEPDLP